MNKKNLTKWELRLGVWQVVAMIGVVTGCMTFAFCLGFFSGQSVGFETARASSASSSAKMPIVADKGDANAAVDVAEEAVAEVYAKLNDKGASKESGPAADAEVPVIGSIKEAELPQVVEEVPSFNDPTIKTPSAPSNTAKDIGEVWDKRADAIAEALPADEKRAIVAPAHTGIEQKEIVPAKGAEELKHETPHQGSAAIVVPGALTDAQRKAIEAEAPPHEVLKTKPVEAPPVKKEELKVVAPKEEVKKPEAPVKVEVKTEKVAPIPPAEAKPAAADGARIVRGTIPKGWFAQVAAPKKGQDAEKIASQLKRSGFTVVIEDAQVRGEQYYRILVGPEGNRKEAEVLVGQLKRENYLQGEPFLRMVK